MYGELIDIFNGLASYKYTNGILSSTLNGLGMHFIDLSYNKDKANPKVYYQDFLIKEHLSSGSQYATALSHEIIYRKTGADATPQYIEGDSQNYTLHYDGRAPSAGGFPGVNCGYHDLEQNITHFSTMNLAVTGGYHGPKASTNDHIVAGPLNDWIEGLTGNDTLEGGDGNDVLYGGEGEDVLYGGNGSDFLFAGAETGYKDSLYGGAGNDLLDGGPAADLLDGGEGFDLAYYANSKQGVNIQLADPAKGISGTATGGDATGDTLISIEGIVGTNANDILKGNSEANEFIGNNGSDELYGYDGNDTLYGGNGDDQLSGGNGNDIIDGGTGNDILAGGSGTDFLYGGEGNDIYLFTNGSGADNVFEEADSSSIQDMAYFVGITNISVYRYQNDLLLAANNLADVMYLRNWYVTKGIEYIHFQDTNQTFTTEYAASIALDITPQSLSVNLSAFCGPANNILDSSELNSNISLTGVDTSIDVGLLLQG